MAVQEQESDRDGMARALISKCIGCTSGGPVVAFVYATVDASLPLQAGLCGVCQSRLSGMGTYTDRLHVSEEAA